MMNEIEKHDIEEELKKIDGYLVTLQSKTRSTLVKGLGARIATAVDEIRKVSQRDDSYYQHGDANGDTP